METFLSLWRAVAIGASVGLFIGLLRVRFAKKLPYDEERQQRMGAFGQRFIAWLAGGIVVVLLLSLIWTFYFLGLGLADPAQTEYAANAATLIVSFATIFSIIIAFYEFMRPGRDDEKTGKNSIESDDSPQDKEG